MTKSYLTTSTGSKAKVHRRKHAIPVIKHIAKDNDQEKQEVSCLYFSTLTCFKLLCHAFQIKVHFVLGIWIHVNLSNAFMCFFRFSLNLLNSVV